MNQSDRTKIRDIKSKVGAMLQERHLLEDYPSDSPSEGNEISVAEPSKYWSDFCSFFDYMLGLPEEFFAKLRLHTYHLTGDNYQFYYFGKPGKFWTSSNLDRMTEGLPSSFIINEPEGGIGFHYPDGRFVSQDIVRYQRVLNTFYRCNVLPELAGSDKKRRYVLEIGGGYGGFAHHFSNIYENITYIMVDLPETLLFSGSYLSLLNPQKKIYIYEKNGFQQLLQTGAWDAYDFILLPNYVLDSLNHLRFDVVVNQASFQEMRTSQVELYLDFIKKTCKGVLYSLNQDHQPRNKELSNLSDLLKQRFELVEVAFDWQPDKQQDKQQNKQQNEKKLLIRSLKARLQKNKYILKYIPRKLKSVAADMGLLKQPDPKTPELPSLPHREYICRPLIYPD